MQYICTKKGTVIKIFFNLKQANSDAAQGTYAGGVSGAAGDAGLFVANHAY